MRKVTVLLKKDVDQLLELSPWNGATGESLSPSPNGLSNGLWFATERKEWTWGRSHPRPKWAGFLEGNHISGLGAP